MKKIMIITDRKRIVHSIYTDLVYVFENKVEIIGLTFDDIKTMDELVADVYLFTLENRLKLAESKIKNIENAIVIKRTIREKELVRILQIPKNTKVLVVNDDYQNTIQFVSLLYALNFDNVTFIPYKEGEDYSQINIAVTPGEVEHVPKHIKNIIDVGDRCLDIPTFLQIAHILGINDSELSNNLLKYLNDIVNTGAGVKEQYKSAVIKNNMMEKVLEMTEQGILMCMPDGEIVLHNEKIEEIADVTISDGLSNIIDIFDDKTCEILKKKDLDNELMKIAGKDVVVKKNKIIYNKDTYENLFFFGDITYLKSLEETVRGQSVAKGMVAKYTLDDIVFKSKEMKECIESVKVFSETNETILLEGESGTGKELLAQSIHNLSSRRYQPFVAINCAALPANLLESELFGYEKGAFTGARKEGKIGLFESANHGTIFLDEIGDMPFELQARLLRVIQEKQIMKVGSDKVIDIDVRIVAATNKKLISEVENGNFRRDLYYRLSVLPIAIPPLRDRKADIIPIFEEMLSKKIDIPVNIKKKLESYNWPGNIRELKNVAGYYELMHGRKNCLPEYLVKDLDNKNSQSTSIEKEILNIIYINNKIGKSIGRDRILEELKKHINATEYSVRKELSKLSKLGYINIHSGRKGIEITKNGMDKLG